jgi:hypothetical protein
MMWFLDEATSQIWGILIIDKVYYLDMYFSETERKM